MKHKFSIVIVIIGIIVFGLYNIVVQSCTTVNLSNNGSNRKKVDVNQKSSYQNIIYENQNSFDNNINILKYSKDWFEETLELLKQDDLENIMFLYSNGVEKDISDLVYELYILSDSEDEQIFKELELSWDGFCDNFEYAYFNKSQSAEYENYVNKAIENLNKVIEIINII